MSIDTNSKEQKLQRIIECEKILNEIQDVDVLLDRVLTEARGIVHADAGSIYVCEGNNIHIKYSQNDTMQRKLAPGQKMPYSMFSFPVNEKSISGYCVLKKEVINIPEAYAPLENVPYKFNKQTDMLTGYRTKSILTIPLLTANGRTLGVLQIINAQDDAGELISFDEDAELYIKHFASSATQALERAYLTRAMVMRMIHMAEFRDPKETGAHVNRVSSYAIEIYDRWAFDHKVPNEEFHKFRDSLKIAAMLHDVGKVGVSDLILKKPGRFTPEEYCVIQAHTYIGASLFSEIESELDTMAQDVALRHHERWDGKGYPGKIDLNEVQGADKIISLEGIEGLKGTEIPLAARIVAIADVFDALSCKRVYKEAWSDENVLIEIQSQAGKQFDPEIVMAFFQVLPTIREIQAAWPDE